MVPTHDGLTSNGSAPQRTKARPATHDGSTSNGLAPQHQREARPATWQLQQKNQEVVSPKAQA